MPNPQLIQVNKYPNRRLYDQTRSRHLTHEELFDLVIAGHTVSVTDSKSGADITNLVLAQALIERSPEKFSAFPPELLHLMIRASDQMLRGFASTWFAQVLRSVPMGGVGGMGGGTPAAGFPWSQSASPQPQQSSPPPSPPPDPISDLQSRMEALMREMSDLKGRAGR